MKNNNGNQKIVPHVWFDTQAKEAAELYVSLFPKSRIALKQTIHGTPSGDAEIVSFNLAGEDFMAISAGPDFKINPSISLFAIFDDEAEMDKVWKKLSKDGTVRMEYQSYPWAKKYGWLSDKYGLSWQLSMGDLHKVRQRITPLLMFTKGNAGKARKAMEAYTKLFPDSQIDMIAPYEKGEGDVEGYIKHARFTIAGQDFMAMDSSVKHDFTFNEAVSFIVNCDTQQEIDYYWNKLSAVPESEQCGWLKDEFGVSWQIVPRQMGLLLSRGTNKQKERVTQAFLKMKKIDINALEAAHTLP